MIVADTNLIAYLVVPGTDTQMAEDVHSKDPDWVVPWLWRSEMRNLLSLYVQRGVLSLNDVQTYMATAEKLLIGQEYDVVSDDVLAFSSASGCTAYDCEFVYLADRLAVKLVTSDKKLLSAFPNLVVSMPDFLKL